MRYPEREIGNFWGNPFWDNVLIQDQRHFAPFPVYADDEVKSAGPSWSNLTSKIKLRSLTRKQSKIFLLTIESNKTLHKVARQI